MENAHQNAKRIKRVCTAHYQGTPEQVFPLLCPVLEYDWLEHWDAEIVYTESGVAELDCIFKTFFHPGATEVWTLWIRITSSVIRLRYRIITTEPATVLGRR